MKTRSLSERTQKLNNILRDIKELTEENEIKLIRFLVLEEGYTLGELAKPLGVSSQAMYKKYPDLAKEAKS